jgi:hypothetical protein
MASPFMRAPPELPPPLAQPDIRGIASYVQRHSDQFSSDDLQFPEDNESTVKFTPLENIYQKPKKKLSKKKKEILTNNLPGAEEAGAREGNNETVISTHQFDPVETEAMLSWPKGWEIEDEAILNRYRDSDGDTSLPPVNMNDLLGSIFGQPFYKPKPPRAPTSKESERKDILKVENKAALDSIITTNQLVAINKNDKKMGGCCPIDDASVKLAIKNLCCSLSRAEAESIGLHAQNEDDDDLAVSAYHLSLVLRYVRMNIFVLLFFCCFILGICLCEILILSIPLSSSSHICLSLSLSLNTYQKYEMKYNKQN